MKKMFLSLGVVAVLAFATVNVGMNKSKKFSNLKLFEIEALAQNEGGDSGTCTASIGCPPYGPHDYVSCTGTGSNCHRYPSLGFVSCDGNEVNC